MRRNYLAPQYIQQPVAGSFEMKEKNSFFSSKLVSIPNEFTIDNSTIFYFQDLSGEQINLAIESLNPAFTINIETTKINNHSLVLDPTQSSFSKETKTKWLLNVNLFNIFTDYVFGKLKESRCFEGILNANTKSNNVDLALREYIELNIFERYRLSNVDLYLSYNNLLDIGKFKYSNTWDSSINVPKLSRVTLDTTVDLRKTIVSFNQERDANQFSFNYYFNLKYLLI